MHALQSNEICMSSDWQVPGESRLQQGVSLVTRDQSWGVGWTWMALGGFIKPFMGFRSPLSPKSDFWQGGTTVATSLGRVAACRRFLRLLPPSTLKTSHHPALFFCCSSLTVVISTGIDVGYNFQAHWFCSCISVWLLFEESQKDAQSSPPLLVYTEWTLWVPKCHLFTRPAWPYFSFIHGFMTLSPLLWEKDY